MTVRAIGGHHSAAPMTTTWLTPPHIQPALGGWASFALDPCAAPAPRPWPTAQTMNAETDGDGLSMEWDGRVWLNPPYTSSEIGAWLEKLADHGEGTALIFARTETAAFQAQVWERASGLLMLAGRLHFHYPDGRNGFICADRHDWQIRPDDPKQKARWCAACGMAGANAGAPSVLCAYGYDDMDRLASSDLPGAFVPLRFARFALVTGLDLSWSEIMRAWIARQSGPVSVSDAYRFFARHPKAASNENWRAKVRQKIAQVGHRVGPNAYVAQVAA